MEAKSAVGGMRAGRRPRLAIAAGEGVEGGVVRVRTGV